MYEGVKLEARAEVGLPILYFCLSCQLQTTASVVGIGSGVGFSHYGIDAPAARDEAQLSARSSAISEAKRAAGIAPCPRCGKRNASKTQTFFLQTIALALLALLGLGGVGWFFSIPTREPLFIVGFGAIGLVFAGLLVYRARRTWLGSTSRVVFPP